MWDLAKRDPTRRKQISFFSGVQALAAESIGVVTKWLRYRE